MFNINFTRKLKKKKILRFTKKTVDSTFAK